MKVLTFLLIFKQRGFCSLINQFQNFSSFPHPPIIINHLPFTEPPPQALALSTTTHWRRAHRYSDRDNLRVAWWGMEANVWSVRPALLASLPSFCADLAVVEDTRVWRRWQVSRRPSGAPVRWVAKSGCCSRPGRRIADPGMPPREAGVGYWVSWGCLVFFRTWSSPPWDQT